MIHLYSDPSKPKILILFPADKFPPPPAFSFLFLIDSWLNSNDMLGADVGLPHLHLT